MVNKGLNAPQLHAGAHQPPHTAMMTTSAMLAIAAAEYARPPPARRLLHDRMLHCLALLRGDVMLMRLLTVRSTMYGARRRVVLLLIEVICATQTVPVSA